MKKTNMINDGKIGNDVSEVYLFTIIKLSRLYREALKYLWYQILMGGWNDFCTQLPAYSCPIIWSG